MIECNCESMGGRFGAHRPECPWQVAFEEQLAAEVEDAPCDHVAGYYTNPHSGATCWDCGAVVED